MAELNIKPNALFTGDNLRVLNGMNSESVDLIYLDPPFNSKRTYEAPIGRSKAAGASFKDIWTWDDVDEQCLERLIDDYPYMVQFIQSIDSIHGKAMMSYVTFMAQRIIELHRVLKQTGSLYLHCDPTASHYLKIVLDRVFGKSNFRNEIIWHYKTGGISRRWFGRKHDSILFYSKSEKYTFSAQKEKSYLLHKYGFKNIEILHDRTGYYRLVYVRDVWDIPALRGNQPETTGYPTQKPLALLRRIIEASSKKGDVILDPFCGCATAMVAAQNTRRQWIGIDLERKAAELVVERLSQKSFMFDDFTHREDIPQRTDVEEVPETRSVKVILYNEQRGMCRGCGERLDERHLEIDHIIPKSRGGGGGGAY